MAYASGMCYFLAVGLAEVLMMYQARNKHGYQPWLGTVDILRNY